MPSVSRRGRLSLAWQSVVALCLAPLPLAHRSELEGQLVDLAGELERRVVAVLQHRDAGARVLADVEGFVLRERDRGGVLHGFLVHLLAVHGKHARAPLAQARTIGLEVEDDGMLAGLQLGPFPRRALEVEQVVEEHHLAPTNPNTPLLRNSA